MTDYLTNLGGTCGVSAGPSTCARLTCVNTSSIYLCNDNAFDIAPSCSYLASYVSDILNNGCSSLLTGAVSGQEFDTDGYNVVLAYANCNDLSNTLPSSYEGPGPNGDPAHVCGNCI